METQIHIYFLILNRKLERILFILHIALISIAMHAQENPERGFVITNEKDTLYGTIDFRTNKINCKQCAFKADGTEEYKTYMPGDIIGYRFMHNGKFYVSHPFEYEGTTHNVFAEYMIKGTLNVYRVIGLCRDDVFFFENEDNKIVSFRNREVADEANNSITMAEARNLSAHLLKSEKAIKEVKVGYMPVPTILKIANLYHEDVCTSNEDCIQFEYDPRSERAKMSYNVHAGWTHYFGLECNYAKIYDVPTVGVTIELNGSRRKKNLLYQVMLDYAYGKGHSETEFFDYNTIANAKAHIFCLRVGPQYRFGKNSKMKFTVRGGVSALMNVAKEKSYNIKYNAFKHDYESWELHDKTYFDACFCAAYAGIGLDYHLGKGDFIANIDAFTPHVVIIYGAPSISASIGYRF